MKIKDAIGYSIKKAADFFLTLRSPWLTLIKCGAGIFIVALGGGAIFNVIIPGTLSFSFDTSSGLPIVLTSLGLALGGALIIIGVTGLILQSLGEYQLSKRKRILVIEQRGLRDTSGTPLLTALPKHLKGRREELLIDIRQRIKDGTVIDPNSALDRVLSLSHQLEIKTNGIDRQDTDIAYGGLMPVPFAFLTGFLIDDEGQVLVMDWDRDREQWRELDATDDGDRFHISGLDSINRGQNEVILGVSVSYKVDQAAIFRTLGNLPFVHMDLLNGTTSSHWSADKQKELARAFRDTIIKLNNIGIQRIHLFVAAPNSMVFNLGRTYDKRNLPEVRVYQYERSSEPPYPWSVKMPTHGQTASVQIT